MPIYETVFIARQDLSPAQTETLTADFAAIIANNGGTIDKTEQWGLRNLAYKIRKNRKGHYVLFQMDAPPAALKEMERNMRLSEDVLRYMSIKLDAAEEGPSVMMRQKDYGDDRSASDRYRGPIANDDATENEGV